jgi:hypothetical protein
MNVKIGTEAKQFLFWKYLNGFFVAVQAGKFWSHNSYIYHRRRAMQRGRRKREAMRKTQNSSTGTAKTLR